MIKRMLLLVALAATVGIALPNKAVADPCLAGRITALTGNSISISGRETLTFAVDGRTRYTRWITQGPWQAHTHLTASSLYVGRLVYVHMRDDSSAARWVQIAIPTDMY